MLSQQQIDTIKATIPVLEQYGQIVTTVFYENLIRDYPSLSDIFSRSNQVNGHQAKALAHAVYAYAQNIDDPQVLAPVLDHITQKHASLFIQPEQYDLVGEYLIEAFAEVLQDAFTPAIRNAWAAAYFQLAGMMIAAEKKLYDNAAGWTDWRDFIIQDKIQESTEITSFILAPKDKKLLPSYLSGQYISIRVEVPQLHSYQPRQYSLSDMPSRDHYRISVRKDPGVDTQNPHATAHPGYVSNILHDEKNIGDIVQLSRPAGEFFLDPKEVGQVPIVLISAGVGLTPLMSMLNTMLESNRRAPITWIHGARSTGARAFSKQLHEAKEAHPNLRTVTFVKQPTEDDVGGVDYHFEGRASLEKCDRVRDLHVRNDLAVYYICGPDSFMSDMQTQLWKYGVDESRIRTERFGAGSAGASA